MVNIKGNFKLGIAVGKYVLSHNTKGQNFPRVLEFKKKLLEFELYPTRMKQVF